MKTSACENLFHDPLIERYASNEMVACFSRGKRYQTWRRIWLALAKAEKKMGLPITDEQIAKLEKVIYEPIDFKRVQELESELHHDVMAHLHAFAEQAPEAKPILHLGATSAFVTDNADLVLCRDGLNILKDRLQKLCKRLGEFCVEHKAERCVGYTHFQVALPTTVGRRATLWLQDLVFDGTELNHRLNELRLRGPKGTTGTQASFYKLFDGSDKKVRELEALVAEDLGFKGTYAVTGQTYPRKVDSQVLSALVGLGESVAKFGTDVRLLQHMRELSEPFGKHQVGSSAMPFKRNPILSERICSLARMLISLYQTGPTTAANQWLERSLDDSAVRRLSIPRAFLLADAVLNLAFKIVDGMTVHKKVVAAHLKEQLPFLLTEMLLMEGVKEGDDRQELHEIIRRGAMEAFQRVTEKDGINDLLERLEKEERLAPMIKRMRDEKWEERFLVGRAEKHVEEFVAGPLAAFLES